MTKDESRQYLADNWPLLHCITHDLHKVMYVEEYDELFSMVYVESARVLESWKETGGCNPCSHLMKWVPRRIKRKVAFFRQSKRSNANNPRHFVTSNDAVFDRPVKAVDNEDARERLATILHQLRDLSPQYLTYLSLAAKGTPRTIALNVAGLTLKQYAYETQKRGRLLSEAGHAKKRKYTRRDETTACES